MKREPRLLCLFTSVAVLLAWRMAAAPAGEVSGTTSSHPNIVFILGDDHGSQAISAYGSPYLRTPNIDRIAQHGVRFTHAYANNSICSPSRAILLTGKYNHLCGVERLDEHFDGAQQTFPKLLQQAGYETAIVGKWHLFSEPTGFDYYCVAPGNGGRYLDPLLKEKGEPWINGNRGGKLHPGYMTDVITDVALDWLKRRAATKPFCLMIHHKAPHGPHIPAPRHKDLFQDISFPEPPTLLDDYRGRAPEPVADQIPWSRLKDIPTEDYRAVKSGYSGEVARDTALMYQAYLRGYLRLVATLDEDIGRVLDYLDASGLARNTIVIYAADNGFFLGEHGFYNKMWMYEEGFHIPLIVHVPGMQTATTNDEIVGMIDFAPTLLDLAGVAVPAEMQGRSVKPLLSGRATDWRQSFYYHYYGYTFAADKNWIASPAGEIVGVRTKTAKLILYPKWKGGAFWELFDLNTDPRELHNLHADAAHQPAEAALQRQLRALAEQYRDPGAVEALDALARSGPTGN